MKIRGTKEWAVANVNSCIGCSNGCRYCYARYDAVVRKKTVAPADWEKSVPCQESSVKEFPLFPGQVMFPANHDILPSNLEQCSKILERLLVAGNQVLIVSKPHLICIEHLCERFADFKDKILFRFTITAADNAILSFWEPNAPKYEERVASLQLATTLNFNTSVSVEPMLDCKNVVKLVAELEPWVTHSIWLGKMNKIEQRVISNSDEMRLEVQRIHEEQSDYHIITTYEKLKDNPLVRWKESIKEVVGIQPVTDAGLDI